MATMYVYNIPTNETVNLRKTPASDGTILVRVGYGKAVQANYYNSTWHSASYGGYSGYIMSKYLTSTNPSGGGTGGGGSYIGQGTVIGGRLYCRKQPQAGYAYWGQFNTGDTIPIYSCSTSGWYETRWPANGSDVGYVVSQYIQMGGGGGGTGVNTATWAQVKAGNAVYKKESTSTAVCDGVKTLQQYLKNIGYGSNNCGNIVVDGNFGSVTETAVKYFQTECELTSDGIVGSATATKLEQVQTNSYFTNSNYYPLNSSLFTYNSYPYNEISLVARIICAEHGYVGTGHADGRVGVAKVLKNRKDKGGVTLYDKNKTRDFKNVIFGAGQYTTATSAMAYRVKRGSSAFSEAVTYATMVCGGSTPAGASLVTNQLFQKGYTADSATYQAKLGYCRYPATGSKYSFFYN